MTSSQTPSWHLSVVIPTYNRRELVVRAIDSVLAQKGGHRCEVIVVDDESSDGTAEHVSRKYHDDLRVSLIRSARRHASGARNLGFAAAHGNYICFLDSDDYWLPGMAELVFAIFRDHPHLAFVSVDGATIETENAGASRRIVAGAPGWSHADFPHRSLRHTQCRTADGRAANVLLGDFLPAIVNGDLFYLSGLLFRSAVVAQAGPFNERFRYFNDWEFFVRACSLGPGAYADYDGFRRDTGRSDQISRGQPATAMARRRLFIVHAQQRRIARDPQPGYEKLLQRAEDDAHYWMARCLVDTPHRQWRKRYLYRCIQRGYKVLRCLALLAGMRSSAP